MITRPTTKRKQLDKPWYVKNTEHQIGIKNKKCMSFINMQKYVSGKNKSKNRTYPKIDHHQNHIVFTTEHGAVII